MIFRKGLDRKFKVRTCYRFSKIDFLLVVWAVVIYLEQQKGIGTS